MELICDVIIRDMRTRLVVDEARSITPVKTLEIEANGNVIYRFNFEFSTAVDKRIVDRIDQIGGGER